MTKSKMIKEYTDPQIPNNLIKF